MDSNKNTNNRFGYKGYNPGLICRGHKYEEGKVYKKNGHGICCPGVTHYCVNPFDVLNHYPLINDDGEFNEFTTVEAIDEPVTDDGNKFATSTIKIGAKLGFDGFVKACVDFLYEKTIKNFPKGSSGDYAKIGSSGDYAQIGSSGYGAKIGSSGDYAKIGSSGDGAQIGSSGDGAQIGSSGDGAQIGSSGYGAQIGSSGYGAKIGSSGDGAQINSTGRFSVISAIGINSVIKANIGTWITLAEYKEDEYGSYIPICVKSAQIDGEILKPDTWYKLENGKFVEVKEI